MFETKGFGVRSTATFLTECVQADDVKMTIWKSDNENLVVLASDLSTTAVLWAIERDKTCWNMLKHCQLWLQKKVSPTSPAQCLTKGVRRCGRGWESCEKLAAKMSRQEFWDLIYVPTQKSTISFERAVSLILCIFGLQVIVQLSRRENRDVAEERNTVAQ